MPDTNKKALIIGVDSYYQDSLEQLPSCKKDATDLYYLLSSKKLGYKIFGDSPIIGSNIDIDNSFSIIQKAIIEFFQADLLDTLLFYFSGHGVPRQDDELFLATPKVDPREPLIGGFRLSDLSKLVNQSRARRIVCIIDSCYSGSANPDLGSFIRKSTKEGDDEIAESARSTSKQILDKILRIEGKYFLLSTQSYSRSYVRKSSDQNLVNSIFTEYLIKGLKGAKAILDEEERTTLEPGSVDDNGNVTPESLYSYLYYKVPRQVPQQVPVLKGSLTGEKITLVEYPELGKQKSPTPPPTVDLKMLLLQNKVEEFNRARELSRYEHLDINATNLSYTILGGVNLSNTDLTKADLSGANLIGAKLVGANLQHAILHRVNLSNTDLTKADLSGANLIGAKLVGAKLFATNLMQANLVRADLSTANVAEANFAGANLQFANLYSVENLNDSNLEGTDLRNAIDLPISKEEAKGKRAIVKKRI